MTLTGFNPTNAQRFYISTQGAVICYMRKSSDSGRKSLDGDHALLGGELPRESMDKIK